MLTHFNNKGEMHMVDVGSKSVTRRTAVATGKIIMEPATLLRIQEGKIAKGEVFAAARLAGIIAAKKTAELVPLCHLIALSHVNVELTVIDSESAVHCCVTAITEAKTGVEMEALCAVQVALLTIYDMCKSVDRGMVISEVALARKSGGRSGKWRRITHTEGKDD